jgi:hypothetical protein
MASKVTKIHEATVAVALSKAEDSRKARDWNGVVTWAKTASASAAFLAGAKVVTDAIAYFPISGEERR